MSGFVAVLAADRRTQVAEREVDGLAAAFAELRESTVRRHVAAGDHARVVELTREHDPAPAGADGPGWLVTAGAPHGHSARPQDLEGQFGLVAYDPDREEVTVATDPSGLLAVYVARRDGKTYVSTSALALAKHLRLRPNRFGLETFLRAGYHFGALTNWEGVERLEPGGSLVFGPDGVRAETYWRPEIDANIARLNFDETVRRCSEVAAAAYAELLAHEPAGWADLTGGFDTRLMLLLLRAGGVSFRTNTTGEPGDLEVQIAQDVAATAGWEWTRVAPAEPWAESLEQLLDLSVGWCDGHLNVVDVAGTLFGHREKSRAASSLLVGGGGEHFRNFAWQQEFLAAGKSNRVNIDNWVDMRLLHPLDVSALARDPTPEVRADMARRMLAWASPYSSELNTTQLDVMYMYKMTGHFGSYLSAAGAFLRTQMPLYFRPALLAAFSSNHRYRANHRLMRHLIASLDPRVAAVTTTNGGPAEPYRPANIHRFLPYYLHVGRRAVTKLSYKATGRALLASGTGSSPALAAGRRRLVGLLAAQGVLDPEQMRTRPLYDPVELRRLVERAHEGDLSGFDLLGRIATLELALRRVDAAVPE